MAKFEQHLVRFTKVIVLIAATSTVACMALLLGGQLRFWLMHDEWNSYPLSSLLANRHDTYSVASVSKATADQVDPNPIVEWVMDMPTVFLLVIALVVLIGFSMFLSRIEKSRLSL